MGIIVLSGFGGPLSSLDPASAPLWAALRSVAAWVRSDRLELQKAGIQRVRRADPSLYTKGRSRISERAQAAILALATGDGLAPTQIARIRSRSSSRLAFGPAGLPKVSGAVGHRSAGYRGSEQRQLCNLLILPVFLHMLCCDVECTRQ